MIFLTLQSTCWCSTEKSYKQSKNMGFFPRTLTWPCNPQLRDVLI